MRKSNLYHVISNLSIHLHWSAYWICLMSTSTTLPLFHMNPNDLNTYLNNIFYIFNNDKKKTCLKRRHPNIAPHLLLTLSSHLSKLILMCDFLFPFIFCSIRFCVFILVSTLFNRHSFLALSKIQILWRSNSKPYFVPSFCLYPIF